ncbi:FtsB family cell division protein [Marisediminicola senii]|uniref:FtsB family cell division protein n=1 Tax=Marisediminicola senii TaxID=2711233 RepID=UPI0013EA6995|nr:septum formation initiator family protein [Marisediminicola senii]
MTRRQRTRQVPVALPTSDTGPTKWLRSIRLSGFTIVALTLVILTIVVLAPSLRILVEQQREIAALEATVAQQQAAVEDLEEERARWDDTSYLESRARERLDYVFPGEFSLLVIDDGESLAAPDGLPISENIQATDVDWISTMFSSVLTAGLTDAAAGEIVAPVLGTDPTPAEQPVQEVTVPDDGSTSGGQGADDPTGTDPTGTDPTDPATEGDTTTDDPAADEPATDGTGSDTTVPDGSGD